MIILTMSPTCFATPYSIPTNNLKLGYRLQMACWPILHAKPVIKTYVMYFQHSGELIDLIKGLLLMMLQFIVIIFIHVCKMLVLLNAVVP